MEENGRPNAEPIRLRDYTYHLPDERIARYPLSPRDSSRLLVYGQGTLEHRRFTDLPRYLPADTLLVFNNTKVIPARAYFQKPTGATVEVLLLHPELPTRVINDAMLVRRECVWACMIGNKKRWKPGEVLSATLTVGTQEVLLEASYADYDQNQVRLRWVSDHTFLDVVQALGEIPLPPYLKRGTEASDKHTYQTVYARHEGAVAAPTAGLHFTDQVLEQLAAQGTQRAFLALHVGAGTFQPIKASTVTEHRMHAEQVVYSRELVGQLLEKADQIVAVGTTSLRSLESLYWYGVKLLRREGTSFWIEKLYPYPLLAAGQVPSAPAALAAVAEHMDEAGLSELVGETEIFIFPGYRFQLCRGLITNFHQPDSTLILLVAAFVGPDWRRLYDEALSEGYRFLSYGDSSLLWRS
ncbi:S-adenosylmethionine:tRNA ribosyltransferase-isomerase [Rhabdobacter roseus]|uniref:S-adenosylmethionine:tRNA ribosyltransferase-isomerase n=1 Tax=Rhabdobacter roseus TaxID=1655419 RepID=A0A840TQJ0_9BACT|nr:S-adenosylmethionine:tRNA ribosyltransferase-isomerase [Rhabdobacter roseus]MBB5285175.1 S-adenosylmethionine:tRNA ribosyltransferase-isomerase [Rhabdobacter roseus]